MMELEQQGTQGTCNRTGLVGGAALIHDFLDADLIDEFIISVIPTLLGEGIPLFRGDGKEKQLELLASAKDYRPSGIVQLHYQRTKRKRNSKKTVLASFNAEP